MGNHFNDTQGFNKNDWLEVSQPSSNVTLWQNRNNSNFHIEEHKVYTLDSNELNQELDLYYRRKNHSRWVAALYFKEKSSEQFCVSRSIAHIFIQKIPVIISDLKDLPIPDAIHTYSQCLQGFGQLASIFGCFWVHPEYIGVNQMGVVKVWAGSNWSQLGMIGEKISQQDMVRSIVGIIDQYVNENSGDFPSIKNYLYRKNDTLNFHIAMRELREYSNITNDGVFPSRLESLYDHRQFDEFMEPMLRSTIHRPNESVNRGNVESFDKKDRRDQIATLKKVEQKGLINESYVVPLDRVLKAPEEDKMRERSITVSKYENNTGKYDAPAGLQRSNTPTIQINTPREPESYRSHLPPRPNYESVNRPGPDRSLLNIQYKPEKAQQINYNQSRSLSQQPKKDLARSFSRQQPLVSGNTAPRVNFKPPQQNSQYQPMPISHQAQGSINSHPTVQFGRSIQQAQSKAAPLNFTKPPPQNFNEGRNKPMPESIIMELYKSQDRFGGNSKADPPTKEFGQVKRAESIRFDESKPSIPLSKDRPAQNPNLAGSGYRHQSTSLLRPIQEVHTQQSKIDSMASSNHNRVSSNTSSIPVGQTSAFNSNRGPYAPLNPNDGKSSEQMMRLLRQIRN